MEEAKDLAKKMAELTDSIKGTLSERFLESLTNEQLLILAEEKHASFVESITKLRELLASMSDSPEKKKIQEEVDICQT